MLPTVRACSIPFLAFLCMAGPVQAQDSGVRGEDGYEMWLRYGEIADSVLAESYRTQLSYVVVEGDSPTIEAVQGEIERGLSGLLGTPVDVRATVDGDGALVIGTPGNSGLISSLGLDSGLAELGAEGYLIEETGINGVRGIVVAANEEAGVLHGVFHLLRLLQTHRDIDGISVRSAPRIERRVVNHWDNLDRTVERGYAGISLWDWGTLPAYRDPRYVDYARINASLGINGTVINNVNADPEILMPYYLEKVAALADVFRPYGIRVYLSVNFFAPMRIGGLDTADPLDPAVQHWWREKVEEVYSYVPDFGGFLVKADSEGQPGPHEYGRDHATGANMFAEALAPHGGVVMWRAFVYDPGGDDRFREAYDEFVPLDGRFMDNVIVQVKNGPIDFQPREPFAPLFGALPGTNTMLELQVTQEYFGFATNLTYKGPLYTEVLDADTHANGEGSTVASVIDGSLFGYELTGIAGVINPGTARNWTGHPFVQSSWYAYGRLAWDPTLTAEEIADEWVRMTFTNDQSFVRPVTEIMMASREAGVNYRSPLGLTHLYSQGDHYGPAPWTANLPRPEWTAVYYHKADEEGIGFDRTETGSNAVAQYHEPVARIFRDPDLVPDDYLLWFHHVGWDHRMKSGRTLWNELVHRYYEGVEQVRWMRQTWNSLEGLIDPDRFEHVNALLAVQEDHAIRWRDSCVLYFQSFSGAPIPEGYEPPEHDLDYYMNLQAYIPRF